MPPGTLPIPYVHNQRGYISNCLCHKAHPHQQSMLTFGRKQGQPCKGGTSNTVLPGIRPYTQ